MPIRYYNGKILYVGGVIAHADACCCTTNTCDSCGVNGCCYSDQSYADVTWSFTADTTGWSAGAIAAYNAIKTGTKRLNVFVAAGGTCSWTLTDGNNYYTLTPYFNAGYDFVFTWTDTVTGDSFGFRFGPEAGDCCSVLDTGRYVEWSFGGNNGNDLTGGDLTVSVGNNYCCKCDVAASPTCVTSPFDYCPAAPLTCTHFTGGEAVCDDAP